MVVYENRLLFMIVRQILFNEFGMTNVTVWQVSFKATEALN